jgi:WD40 repeat protein
LWDALSGNLLGRVDAHDGGADSVSFSPDGTLLASGGRDTLVKLWRVSDLHPVAEYAAHKKPVLSLAFSPDGTLLATTSGDNTLRIWGIPF